MGRDRTRLERLEQFNNGSPGANPRDVFTRLQEVTSVLDFIPSPQHAAILNYTSTFDCTSYIQAAIDYVIYNSGTDQTLGAKRVVHIPGGLYNISNTIHLGYGTSFTSVFVEGDGPAYDSAGTFCGTCIKCSHNNSPAFNFQGARYSEIRRLSIFGQNQAWISSHNLGSSSVGAPTLDDTQAANWVDSSFPASASSQYAPYAAITIDAYSGAQPGTAYPAVTYPAFLGIVNPYNKNFSSAPLIEDVYINGFVVGIANQPCNADGNGDFPQLRRVLISNVQYAFSVGNTQCRNVSMMDVQVNTAYTVLTSNQNGKQLGKYNGTISNLSCSQVMQVVQFGSSAFFGPLTFLHLYCEGLWRIGDITSTSAQENSITFQSCQFSFQGQSAAVGGRGIPGHILGGVSQQIDICFKGCQFDNYLSVVSFNQLGVRFDGCSFLPSARNSGSVANEYIGIAHNATCGGLVLYQIQPTGMNRIKFKQVNLDTLAIGGAVQIDDHPTFNSASVARPFCAPIYSHFCQGSADIIGGDAIVRPNTRIALAEAGASLSGTTLTFTNGGITTANTLLGFEVGDIIWHDATGSVFFIRARTGTTVTAELQNNYAVTAGPTYTPIAAINSGNFYSTNCRLYTPTLPVYGTTSTAANTVTSAGSQDGTNAFMTTDIAVNDWIFPDRYKDDTWPPASNPITNVAAGTLTLTGNANINRTFPEHRFPWFIRKAPANV